MISIKESLHNDLNHLLDYVCPRANMDKAEARFGMVKDYLKKLGNPHLSMGSVIHVAGTNGKGSTIAFMQTLLRDMGYRVYSFTSPHIYDYTERICIDGHPIDKESLIDQMMHIHNVIGLEFLSFFEVMTLSAFCLFKRDICQYAALNSNAQNNIVVLLETGVGGRLDPTNHAPKDMAVITPIDYDHQALLGNDIASIAREKAGIIRGDCLVVSANQKEEARAIMDAHAHANNHLYHRYGRDFSIQTIPSHKDRDHGSKNHEDRGGCFILTSSLETADAEAAYDQTILRWPLYLCAPYQAYNASLAIEALRVYMKYQRKDRGSYQKLYDPVFLQNSLDHTKWKGRFERVTIKNHQEVYNDIWVDGAHNEAGCRVLCETIDHYFLSRNITPKIILLTQLHKNSDAMKKVFDDFGLEVICKALDIHDPESMRAIIIKEIASQRQMDMQNGGGKVPIILCGSLYILSIIT